MKVRGIVLAGLTFVAGVAQAERVIGEGDTWRYYKGNSTPPLQGGTNWTQLGFVDTTWVGPAPSGFGYGDCDDATSFLDMQNAYVSVFIRRSFNITDTNSLTRLTLAADYDDGFVAYVNGTEIVRTNMPAGAVTHTTLATGNHESSRGEGGSNPQEKIFIPLNPALLVPGNNVLTVSGHNTSSNSSDLTLIVELYTNVTLVRGPFIQMPDSNQVTVVWRTEALTDSAVDYGLTPGYEAGTVSLPAAVREHVVNIPGLVAGTNYYYRVRSGGVTLSDGNTFRTRAAPAQPFRFVVIGDHGQGTAGMTNIANRINARTDFDLVVTVGDNVYGVSPCTLDGAPGWYDPFFFKLYGPTMTRVPLFPTLGNHDVDTANGQWSLDYFMVPTNGPAAYVERNYSFQYGNAHFCVIDSNPYAENNAAGMAAVKAWVSNDLAAATAPWKFVFYHHPPYTSQGSHNDQVNLQNGLTPLFAQFGVQMAFQGHNHFYERINAIQTVRYLTTGASGASLYGITNRKEYSHTVVANIHSYTHVEMDGTRLTLRQIDANGVQVDLFQMDLAQPFTMDGLLDAGANPAWLRADNGLKLYAAIRQNQLYVATQDAGEGSDHFFYVHDQLSTNRPANWAKAGTVMQWSAFLADENSHGFHGWFGSTEAQRTNFPAFQSMTSGLNNNGVTGNGVLEGSLNLPERFGYFPTNLYLAAAAFGSADAGVLAAQVPTGNGDGNLTSTEFLLLNPRAIALDLPVANAGAAQTNEAGFTLQLNGTASTAPSGLPLSFNWTQLTGPPVALVNSNTVTASFAAASNVVATTDFSFQLTIHDTRFASNAVAWVTLYPWVDADGDGLSNQEELTGQNNTLTPLNPTGQITNPNQADSDGDGQSDGAEAWAGTNPNTAASVLRVTELAVNPGGFRLDWTAVPGKTYAVEFRDDLGNTWSNLSTVSAITSQTNVTDSSAIGQPRRFYRVRVEP